MKLVTFNIRCDFGQDGENNFEYRKDLIFFPWFCWFKKIAQEKPDMICFQEVLPHIAKWLKENLTEYYMIAVCSFGDFDRTQPGAERRAGFHSKDYVQQVS